MRNISGLLAGMSEGSILWTPLGESHQTLYIE